MHDNRKQAVSIRLGAGDIRKVKRLAERLGVRDSDVIRFALKWTMNRIAPICDPEIRGRSLVPMFVETGTDLIRYFELDAFRLESIINAGVDKDRSVSHDDIALLALAGMQQPYALPRARSAAAGPAPDTSAEALRTYLYDKYVYARSQDPAKAPAEQPLTGESPPAGEASLVALIPGQWGDN